MRDQQVSAGSLELWPRWPGCLAGRPAFPGDEAVAASGGAEFAPQAIEAEPTDEQALFAVAQPLLRP